MLTATLRAMLAHKLRLILTTSSIALGIAFLAGTMIMGDTTKLAFDQLFGKVSSGTDAIVRDKAAYAESAGTGTSRSPVDASILAKVRSVNGVAAAEGNTSAYALLTDNDGKAVLGASGAPTMGYTMSSDKALRGDVKILDGTAPTGPRQVAIDASSAEDNDIALGSRIKILFLDSAQYFTVVGTVGYGDAKDLGGTTSAYFTPSTAQRMMGTPGTFNQIDVRGTKGLSDAALAKRLDSVLPAGTEAVTGKTAADEASKAVQEDVKFLNILLTIFAAIALFVGSFIIWNTFTMIVTQRSREIALLRAVGATRRQVNASLLTEALILGAGASAIGLGLGVGVAKGLTKLMELLDFSLPTTTTQLLPRTVIVAMLVGITVTVLAALVPARRATKVLPIEALREAVPGSAGPSKIRALAGFVFAGLGIAGLLSGLYGDAPMLVFGLGILGIVVAVITLAPLAARPLAGLIGAPLRMRGMAGDLARQNAMRNPRRTAATAAALMIGLAMVVSMGVFASSLKASFGDILGGSTNADLFITTASPQGSGFSPTAIDKAAKVPGVAAVSEMGWGMAKIAGGTTSYSSVDPKTVDQLLNLDISSGSARRLGVDGVLVAKKTAAAKGWKVGDAIPAQFAATGRHQLRVAGIFDATGGFAESDYLISLAGQTKFAGPQLSSSGLVLLAKGADQGQVQDGIAEAIAGNPDAKVVDEAEYKKEAAGFIDKLLALVTIMLLLAVVIALLGIVNTLALSVFERTRELGLLRAVGMTDGQVRAMVRWESVVISLIGAIVGAGLGVGLGVALAQALKDEGIKAISISVPQVGLYVVLAAVAGVIAAIGPARSAAKVDVLQAVVTE